MTEDFKQAFNRFKFLTFADLLLLFKESSLVSFKKGELIAREGEYVEHSFLVLKGIVRTYVLTSKGDEKTVKLAKEKDFTACAECYLNSKPSTEFLEAVEDCKLIAFKTEKLKDLSKDNINILRLMYEALRLAMIESIDRVEFFTILTPEERYAKLLQEDPGLIERVPQKYLASFLGITTVSLSRIRNRKTSALGD